MKKSRKNLLLIIECIFALVALVTIVPMSYFSKILPESAMGKISELEDVFRFIGFAGFAVLVSALSLLAISGAKKRNGKVAFPFHKAFVFPLASYTIALCTYLLFEVYHSAIFDQQVGQFTAYGLVATIIILVIFFLALARVIYKEGKKFLPIFFNIILLGLFAGSVVVAFENKVYFSDTTLALTYFNFALPIIGALIVANYVFLAVSLSKQCKFENQKQAVEDMKQEAVEDEAKIEQENKEENSKEENSKEEIVEEVSATIDVVAQETVAVEETTTEEIVAEENAEEVPATIDVVAQETVAVEETTTEEIVAEEIAEEVPATVEVVAQETVVVEETSIEDVITEETISNEQIEKEELSKEELSKEEIVEEVPATVEVVSQETIVTKETIVSKEEVSKEEVSKEELSKEELSKEKPAASRKQIKPTPQALLKYLQNTFEDILITVDSDGVSFKASRKKKLFLNLKVGANDYRITFQRKPVAVPKLMVKYPSITKAKTPAGDQWFKLVNKGEFTEADLHNIIKASYNFSVEEEAKEALRKQKEKEKEALRKQKEKEKEAERRKKEKEKAKLAATKKKA